VSGGGEGRYDSDDPAGEAMLGEDVVEGAAESAPSGHRNMGDDGGRPSGIGHAYLLGESRAMIALRPHLSRLAIASEDIFLKGYWNSGKRAG
jgi:NADPH-dependent ferric siderophore reductase